MKVPAGVVLPFVGARRRGRRIVLSGHLPLDAGGSARPLGNGFSDLIVETFGRERGAHARSAIGVGELPFGVPAEVEAEVEVD